MTPTIGVVVPIYRAERHIANCIASIADQSHRPDHVVLVDDRGGDHSVEVALAAATRAGLNVDLVVQASNSGPSAARNSGLNRLRTDLVWFCDADDTADPRFLSLMSSALERHDAAMSICRTARVNVHGTTISIDEATFGDVEAISGTKLAYDLLLSKARGYSCNKLFRRDILGESPFPNGRFYEDFVPILRLALNADRVALVDPPLYRYLINETSISQRFGDHINDLFEQDHDVWDELCNSGVLDGSSAAEWRQAYVQFRYDGVILPAANMALLAAATSQDETGVAEVVCRARSLIRLADLSRLWGARARRQAVAAAVLGANPWLYGKILRLRANRP